MNKKEPCWMLADMHDRLLRGEDPDEFFPAPMVIEDETARDGSGETEENRPEMVSDTEDKINSSPVSG